MNMQFNKVDRVNFAFFQVDGEGRVWGTDSVSGVCICICICIMHMFVVVACFWNVYVCTYIQGIYWNNISLMLFVHALLYNDML